jgi:clan AA aspartic protease (TIGR02281 family)
MKSIFRLCCCSFFLISFFILAYADVLGLKNGRSIEGIIRKEDAESIELEVGSGVVKFLKSEIADISRSSGAETDSLRNRWQKNKLELDNKLAKQKLEDEAKPRKAAFSHDAAGITLGVTLNNKVKATMVLDTGASLILVTRAVAKKLGVNLDKLKPDIKVQVADGRTVDAARFILNSVKVENSEVENVEAAVLMDEKVDFKFADGLLGMSFLRNFNFKIDQKEKKLILEKY